ncbi:hypothetical protein KUCAC02_005456, partial [Chaenocephalus aceratus]
MIFGIHLNSRFIVPSVPLVLIGLVVFAVSGIFGDPIYECLQDTDYSELLDIVDKGLPPTKTPRHIAIVGGGHRWTDCCKDLRRCRTYVVYVDQKVTIIEASNRIGGRVETFRNNREGWYAEIGAMRIPSFHKILLSFVSKLQISLNPFIQDDINTYYLINGVLQKTTAVENNPGVLNYSLNESERGKSAAQLFSETLWK